MSSRSKPMASACCATAWSTKPNNSHERLDGTMTATTGGEAIVNGLVAHGVDTVFGLPGAQVYGLFDAFHQAQLKVIGARHEQACGYMAYGYARSTGRPGVFSVVPGPGVLNAGAALLTAFGANEPVLCLTGQVPTQFLGKGRGHLHEMPDQLATLRTFVKWAERIEYPDAAPAMVSRARSEEHTSELQSHVNLVCRLLLEKK